jgi:hypothetical protein
MTKRHLWVTAILANPVIEQSCQPEAFNNVQGVIDAWIFLKNTHSYSEWPEGQHCYEESSGKGDTSLAEHQIGIDGAPPIYQHYPMADRILGLIAGRIITYGIPHIKTY